MKIEIKVDGKEIKDYILVTKNNMGINSYVNTTSFHFLGASIENNKQTGNLIYENLKKLADKCDCNCSTCNGELKIIEKVNNNECDCQECIEKRKKEHN